MAKNSYFSVLVSTLPKSDSRYKKWLESLKKRPPPWNKGKTKETDISVKKIFAFTNKNQKLLDDVELGLRKLGFNPEVRSDNIRLRKKKEVFVFKELIKFRKYGIAG